MMCPLLMDANQVGFCTKSWEDIQTLLDNAISISRAARCRFALRRLSTISRTF
jgi:hypothetical protein